MKKFILFMLPFVLTMASCGESESKGLEKGELFTPEFMKANKSIMIPADPYVADYEIKIDERVGLGENVTISDAGNGLLQIVNSESKTGYYSLALGKLLIPFTHSNFSTQAVQIGDRSLNIFKYSTTDGIDNTYHAVDEFGNSLYSGRSSSINITGKILENYEKEDVKEYSRIVVKTKDTFKAYFYSYNWEPIRNGAFESEYKVGDYVSSKANMKDYGHEKYVSVVTAQASATRYAIKDNAEGENKFVSTFEVPTGATSFFAGDYFVYQYRVEVEERATKYTYYEFDGANGHKYDLNTFVINYVTGEKNEVECGFVFSNPTEYFEEDGVKRLALVDAQMIREDKALEIDTRQYFVNRDLEILADVSAVDFKNLIVKDNKYFSTTGVVYNEKLEEINYIPGLQTNKDRNCHIFQFDGMYGMNDDNGKVIMEPLKTDITRILPDLYVAEDSFALGSYKYENGSLIKIGQEINKGTYTVNGNVPGASCVKSVSLDTVQYAYNELSGNLVPRINPTDSFDFSVQEVNVLGEGTTVASNIYHTDGNVYYALRTLQKTSYEIPQF